MSPDVVYRPPPGLRTSLDDFRDRINREFGLSLNDYYDLHDFSIRRLNDFWMSLWNYLPVKASVQPSRAVDESITIDQFPSFFEEARMNYAENMLAKDDDSIALKCMSEAALTPRAVTWTELRELVRRCADAMKASNVSRGDVVCVIGGSTDLSLALLLASASLGAICSSFATDAGERVLLDRIGQFRPKLVFSDSEGAWGFPSLHVG